MKKSMILSLLTCFLLVCSVSFANPTPGIDTLKLQIGNPIMTFNDIKAEIDPGRGTAPVVENGRTLVPIRAIIEALGGSVGWDGATSTVTLTHQNDVIKLVIGSDKATLNGVESRLDVAPTIINERTMLPIRYIAEGFNFMVNWDGVTSTVTIVKNANITETKEEIINDTKNDDYDVHDDPSQTIEEEAPSEENPEINPEDEELNPEDEITEDSEDVTE